MDWLEALRYFNLVAISSTLGFSAAVAWQLRWDRAVPAYIRALGVSYFLFALGSIAEVELALAADAPASWRTALITAGGVIGIFTAVWAWVYHRKDQ